MKVAILTMFNGLSPTYSLVNVVADQVRMLLHARIPVKVLVSESCPDRGIRRPPAGMGKDHQHLPGTHHPLARLFPGCRLCP